MDAWVDRRRVGLEDIEAIQSHGGGWLRDRVQAVKFQVARAAIASRAPESAWNRKTSLGAPRNAPLRTGRKPGAETALFL
jgi:hypothetical protein